MSFTRTNFDNKYDALECLNDALAIIRMAIDSDDEFDIDQVKEHMADCEYDSIVDLLQKYIHLQSAENACAYLKEKLYPKSPAELERERGQTDEEDAPCLN